MSYATPLFVRALAGGLAADRRVMLANDDFELMQVLANSALNELVVLSEHADPHAPEGATTLGAPLRLRADWAERPRSKDLIVDPGGRAPRDEVLRILKKAGIYLTANPDAADASWPHRVSVRGLVATAVVVGDGPPAGLIGYGEPTSDDTPVLYVCGQTRPALDSYIALFYGLARQQGNGTAGARTEGAPAAAAALRERDAARAERDAVAATLRADVSVARAALSAITAERDALLADRDALRAEREGLRAAVSAGPASVELDALRADRDELSADLERVSVELAQRRVEERRSAALRERFERARAEMHAELAELRARLHAAEEPAEDWHALSRERDAWREALHRVAEALGRAVHALLPSWPANAPPPGADADALAVWLAELDGVITRGHAAQQHREQRIAELEAGLQTASRRVRELGEALAARGEPGSEPRDPSDTAPSLSAPPPDIAELRAKVDALNATLQAERLQRESERLEHARLHQAAEAALSERGDRERALRLAQQTAAQARLGRAALQDEIARQRFELERQREREQELESIIATQGRMADLLGDSLRSNEARRDEAEDARRLADENLRVLRGELERSGTPAEPALRQLRAELLAAQRRAADAERERVRTEERLRAKEATDRARARVEPLAGA